MEKLISVLIAVDSADETALSVPLSSINNQLGVDFRRIEVLVIDNGTYQLEDLSRLGLFKHVTLRYLKPSRIENWATAFQNGIQKAHGQYVMFMGPNGQLNSTSALQSLMSTVESHPEATTVSGLTLTQSITATRTRTYQVGRSPQSVKGRLVDRAWLTQAGINFTPLNDYAEELFTRTVLALAPNRVDVEEVLYAHFVARDVAPAVLAPAPLVPTLAWYDMFQQLLARLARFDQATYVETLAKMLVRQFGQLGQMAQTPEAMIRLKAVVAANIQALPAVQTTIQALMAADTAAQAPWNAAPSRFGTYLQQIGLN